MPRKKQINDRQPNHYILTRFNSDPLDPADRDGRNLDDGWLRRRLKLSKKYYRPSLENQTCQNFKVVVAIHPKSPQYIVDFFSDFAEITYRPVNSYPFPVGSITTRLDSDDMIHRAFVGYVQKIHEFDTVTTLVDFDTAWYNHSTNQAGRIVRPRNNSQFISVTHSTREIHCYMGSHTSMHRRIKSQNRSRMLGGIQVIHGDNICAKAEETKIGSLKIDLGIYGQNWLG